MRYHMCMASVLLNLDDEILHAYDACAKEDERTRSAVIREALVAYLEQRRQRSIGQQIVEGYRRIPDTEPEHLYESTRRMIEEEPW